MDNFDKKYGLVGKKLGHSFSRDYFTKKFSELNLNYSYQNIELDNIKQCCYNITKDISTPLHFAQYDSNNSIFAHIFT